MCLKRPTSLFFIYYVFPQWTSYLLMAPLWSDKVANGLVLSWAWFCWTCTELGNGRPKLSGSCPFQPIHAFPTLAQPHAFILVTQLASGRVLEFVISGYKRIFELCFQDFWGFHWGILGMDTEVKWDWVGTYTASLHPIFNKTTPLNSVDILLVNGNKGSTSSIVMKLKKDWYMQTP